MPVADLGVRELAHLLAFLAVGFTTEHPSDARVAQDVHIRACSLPIAQLPAVRQSIQKISSSSLQHVHLRVDDQCT